MFIRAINYDGCNRTTSLPRYFHKSLLERRVIVKKKKTVFRLDSFFKLA